MPEATKTCPHCGAPEDQEFPFMFLCGSSTKVVRRTWACHHIEAMNLVTAVHADAYPVSVHGRRSDEFRRLYGSEEEMLDRVNARLPGLCGPDAK